MCNLSNVLKLFLFKIYLFVIMFAIVFGVSYVRGAINNNPNIIDRGSYVSVGELAVSSSSVNSDNNLDTYMKNVIHRANSNIFADYVVEHIKVDLENELGSFSKFNLNKENLKAVSDLTRNDIKANLLVEKNEGTTIFKVSFSDKNYPLVAQSVNSFIMQCMNDILPDDTDNILGGVVEDVNLSFNIINPASLPTSLQNSKVIDGNSISFVKITIISFAIYVVLVILIDFIIGYITNKQKVKTLVKADLIAEIELPYFKNRKQKESVQYEKAEWNK